MKYLSLLFGTLFCLFTIFSLYTPITLAAVNIVPSPNCLSKNPCVTNTPSTAPSNTVPPGTSVSGQPNSSPSSVPSTNASPSISAPCSPTSQSSVSSQSTGNGVSILARHHGKHHHSAGGGFLQQFIQFLWQLLQQIFKQFGIQLPNITLPCGSGSNSGGNGNGNGGNGGNGNISGTPSGAGGGNSGTPSKQPATSSAPAPSSSAGGSGSTGGGTTTPSGRFGIALGSGWENNSSATLNADFADMASIGVQWVRFDIPWAAVQGSSGGSFNWGPFDNLVNTAKAHGLKSLPILDAAPSWAQQSSCAGQYGCPPNGTSNFATFAAAAATHYKPLGVTTFEIYNEENTGQFWIGYSASAYTALLKAAYTAIHQAVPGDFVISGGLAPSGNGGYIVPNTYVQQMYAAGVKGYFDALGLHPYCFSDPISICTSTSTSNTDAWGQMAWGPNNIVSIMKANGDGNKQIWMTEFGDQNVSEAPQEMKNAFTNTNGQAWAGPIFWYDYTGDGSFGLVGTPAYNMYKQLAGK